MKNRKIPEEKSRFFRVDALIIQSQSFGEGHRRLTLVEKDKAKISVTAFGAAREKSRRRSSLLVGQHIMATLNKSSRQGIFAIKESDLIDGFDGIRENYKRSSWFFIIAEILNVALKAEAGFQKYRLLIETLQKMETSNEAEKYALYFLLFFLLSEGYFPHYSTDIVQELKVFAPKSLRVGNGSLRFIKDVENSLLEDWSHKTISGSVVTNISDIIQACLSFHFQKNINAFSLLINAD